MVHPNNRQPEIQRATLASYVIGFVLSIILTLAAYILTRRFETLHGSGFSHPAVLVAVAALAIAQLFVQLVFFLHLGRESKPRWNLTVLLFAATVVIIVAAGSLWIMANLNYHHGGEPAAETDTYIIQDEGVHK